MKTITKNMIKVKSRIVFIYYFREKMNEGLFSESVSIYGNKIGPKILYQNKNPVIPPKKPLAINVNL